MIDELPSSVVREIAFVGRSGGQVKGLGGFKKGHHTLPDAANDTTNAFLGKICAGEIADEAEALFQAVKAGLGYKRKEVTLAVTSPQAVLTAKDFTVEIAYELEAAEPSRYTTTISLRELRSAELARTEEFSAIFARRFSEIRFVLREGAQVEAVVDVIEALEEESGLTVSYPSDCSVCEIRVRNVNAVVRCTGEALEIVFPQAGSPAELMAAFVAVRAAFAVDEELAGLIG